DNWGDFSAKNVGSKPVTCNEEAPLGSRTFGADFSGFDEAGFKGAPRTPTTNRLSIINFQLSPRVPI
ncbi:MAG: hypothetical protein ACRDEA_23615, partial [Microcystaceae cyanobacterium]